MMNTTPPDSIHPATSSRKEQIVPLAIFVFILALLFRPLLIHDFRQLFFPPPGAPLDRWKVLYDTGADLLCFLVGTGVILMLIYTRIGAIAYNTFREAVRNRILYFILFFALFLMGASVIVKDLAIGEHERIVRHLGLSSISFFGLMVAIFVGISLVYNELERKTIYTIVSKPVHRYQFLLGKYFGLLFTVLVIVAVMTLFFFMMVNYQAMVTDDAIFELLYPVDADGNRDLVDNPGWVQTGFVLKSMGGSLLTAFANLFGFAHGAVSPNLMIVIAMFCLEIMIVTAFAMLYSSFSTPTLSAVLTLMTFMAGRLNEDIIRLAERILDKAFKEEAVVVFSDLAPITRFKYRLIEFTAHVVPNLDSLNVTSQAVRSEVMTVWRYPVLYAICYTGFILCLSILIFRKRNFK